MLRHGVVRGHGPSGDDGHRDLHPSNLYPHGDPGGNGERHGHQLPGGHHLWGDLRGELHERYHRHAHCYSCRGLHLHRLERRRVLGHRRLHRHALRGDDGHRHLRADLRVDGHAGRHGDWNGDEQPGRDQLWGDLRGELHERYGRHADRRARRRLDLHRLEWRRLLRHWRLHRDALRGDDRHCDLHASPRADGLHGGSGRRDRDEQSRRHQLRGDLRGELRQRYRRHADRRARRRLHLQRLERRRLLRHRRLHRHALRGDDGHRDLHPSNLHPHGHPGGNRERYGHQLTGRHRLWRDLRGELHERYRRDAHRRARRRLDLQRLDRRRLLGHWRLHRHALRGDDRHRDFHASPHADGLQGGRGRRDRDEQPRRHRLRPDLRGELHEWHRRDAHGRARRRLDLWRLERRRLLRHGVVRGHGLRGDHRHRDFHPDLHADRL